MRKREKKEKMPQGCLKVIHITKKLTKATKKNTIIKPFQKSKEIKMTANAIYYDTKIRQQAGLSAAVVYNRIKYWCNHNALNKKNIHKGIPYCYQSYSKLSQATGYSIATIKRCLRKLLLLGLIFKREKYKKTEVNNFSIINEQMIEKQENKQSFRLPESNPVQPKNTENKKENTQPESKKQSPPQHLPQSADDWKSVKGDKFFTAMHRIIRKSKNYRQRDLL